MRSGSEEKVGRQLALSMVTRTKLAAARLVLRYTRELADDVRLKISTLPAARVLLSHP